MKGMEGRGIGHDDTNFTPLDRGIAVFCLVDASLFLLMGPVVLLTLYQSRLMFDIKARSPNLLLLTGITILLQFMIMLLHLSAVLGTSFFSHFWCDLVVFFLNPVYVGLYISRAIRLAVVFHPRAKSALPWLIPEKNHIVVLLVVGALSTVIPIYFCSMTKENVHDHVAIRKHMNFAAAAVLTALYPLIRNVDDVFNISKEITAVMFLLFIVAVSSRLVDKYGNTTLGRWFGSGGLSETLASNIVFILSIIQPMRRLGLDPLGSLRRSICIHFFSFSQQQISMTIAPAANSAAESETPSKPSLKLSNTEFEQDWNFERLVSTPLMAKTFEEFSRRALCQESVLFLRDVSRYEDDDFSMTKIQLGDRWAHQFHAFSCITRVYISDDAPNEVNISSRTKEAILDHLHTGVQRFMAMPVEERRRVFQKAYKDIREIVEDNLLRRFMCTEEFERVKTEDKMIDSIEAPESVERECISLP
ncbi:unnamed protein product [Choristocarpus tenellus]